MITVSAMKPGAKNWNEEETPVISGMFVTEMGCMMKVGLTLPPSILLMFCADMLEPMMLKTAEISD